MTEVMKRAISHKGFSLVDCFSPCVTYNKVNTYQWFRQRVYRLEDAKHDASNMTAALARSLEEPVKIPIGVFLEKKGVPTYEDLDHSIQKHGPAVKLPLGLSAEDRKALLQSFL